MRTLTTLLVLASLGGCGKDSSSGAGSATPPPAPPPTESKPEPKPEPKVEAPPADDGSAVIAALVVKDVGSKALGSQTIEASCVSVSLVPAGDWTVAAARLKDCGDKTARTIVWLYKRQGSGKWNEDYVGQPPKCWKGVPPDIAPAVKIATGIPTC
jgi:hypothetical protein